MSLAAQGVDVPGHLLTLFDSFRQDWRLGVAVSGAGLLGALLMAYFVEPHRLPGLGGRADAHAVESDLKRARELQGEVVLDLRHLTHSGQASSPERVAGLNTLCERLEGRIEGLRRDWTSLRRSLMVRAMFIYPLMGSAAAAVVASNLLQGLLVGMIWPLIITTRGLFAEVETVKRGAESVLRDHSNMVMDDLRTLADLFVVAVGAVDARDPRRAESGD